MNIMELGALGELIGSVGVVVTLFYLAIQIRQNTEQQKRVEMESRVSAVNASAAALRENRKAVYQDAELAAHFAPIAEALAAGEAQVLSELAAVQGPAAELGGYYRSDVAKTEAVMRPSETLNAIIG